MKNQAEVLEMIQKRKSTSKTELYGHIVTSLGVSRKSASALVVALIKKGEIEETKIEGKPYISIVAKDIEVVEPEVVKPETVESPMFKKTNVDSESEMRENIGKEVAYTQRGGKSGSGTITGLTINKTKTIFYYLVKSIEDGKIKCVKSENLV